MKSTGFLISFLFIQSTWALPAVSFNCLGRDLKSHSSVVMELSLSDFEPESDYTNRTLTILKLGSETLEKSVVFQLFGGEGRACERNEFGEILLDQSFQMSPTEDNSIFDSKIQLKSTCSEAEFEIQAMCSYW